MKRFLVNDLSEVAYMMYNAVTEDGIEDVVFVGLYDDAVAVMKTLLMFDDTIPYHVTVKPECFEGYDKEYYVTLRDDMNIWCEKAYDMDDECYLMDDTECVFIADDCNSAILKEINCNENNMYEVAYVDDEECNGNCECCECNDNHEVITRVATDDKGRLKGFEKSWESHEDGLHYHSTYSFYSSNQDMLKEMLSNFDIKY